MPTTVPYVLDKQRRTLSRLRALALVESITTVCLFPLIVAAPGSLLVKGIVLLTFSLYARLKVRDILATLREIRQLRMEASFLQQDWNVVQLSHCLEQQDHLWASSLVLEGLRGVQTHPLPGLVGPEGRVDRLRVHFHRAFLPLQRERLNVDWLLAAFAGAIALSNAWPASPLVPVWVPATVSGLLACVALAEAVSAWMQRGLRTTYTSLEEGLATWTLEAKLYKVMFDRRKLYAHTLLYEARPWFKTGERAKRSGSKGSGRSQESNATD